MESEKLTGRAGVATKRWYDDACGTALALEFVGERWSLLVMRELMFGPRRFSEIKAQLPGLSANVLTQRLEGLEAGGIVARRRLPSPANVQVYDLTDWGREAEPIFQEMGRWAVRSHRHDTSLHFSPASAMMSLRTMLDAGRAGDMAGTIAFRFPGDAFVGVLADGTLAVRRGEVAEAAAVFVGTPGGMAAAIYGKMPVEDGEAAGLFRVEGDHAWFARFVDLFHLPAKIDGPPPPAAR